MRGEQGRASSSSPGCVLIIWTGAHLLARRAAKWRARVARVQAIAGELLGVGRKGRVARRGCGRGGRDHVSVGHAGGEGRRRAGVGEGDQAAKGQQLNEQQLSGCLPAADHGACDASSNLHRRFRADSPSVQRRSSQYQARWPRNAAPVFGNVGPSQQSRSGSLTDRAGCSGEVQQFARRRWQPEARRCWW